MEKLQKKLGTNFISYHGCGVYRLDGSNVLITNGVPCFYPIKDCFWMNAKDATNRIRTRSADNNNIMTNPNYKRRYFNSLTKEHTSYSTDESSTSESGYSDNYPSSDEDSNTDKLTIDMKEDSNTDKLTIDMKETD